MTVSLSLACTEVENSGYFWANSAIWELSFLLNTSNKTLNISSAC